MIWLFLFLLLFNAFCWTGPGATELPQDKARGEEEKDDEAGGGGGDEKFDGRIVGGVEEAGDEQLDSSQTERPAVTVVTHDTFSHAVEKEVETAEEGPVPIDVAQEARQAASVCEETESFQVPVHDDDEEDGGVLAHAETVAVEPETRFDTAAEVEVRPPTEQQSVVTVVISEAPEVEEELPDQYDQVEEQVTPIEGDQNVEVVAAREGVEPEVDPSDNEVHVTETKAHEPPVVLKETTETSSFHIRETEERFEETTYRESPAPPSGLEYTEPEELEDLEEESPLTQPKYTSLADPITKELVREKVETIEEVVTQMEHRYDTSVEARSFSQHAMTAHSNEGMFSAEREEELLYRQESRTSVVTEDASEPTTQDFSEIRSEMVESTGSQSDFGRIDDVDVGHDGDETFEDGWGKTSVESDTKTEKLDGKHDMRFEDEPSVGDETIGKEATSDLAVSTDQIEDVDVEPGKMSATSAHIISTEIEGEDEEEHVDEEGQYQTLIDKARDEESKDGAKLSMEILRSRIGERNGDEEQDSLAATTGSDVGRAEEVEQDCLSEWKENELDDIERDARHDDPRGSLTLVDDLPDTSEKEQEDDAVVEEIAMPTKNVEVEMGVVTAPSDEEDEVEEEKPVVEESIVSAKAEEVEVAAPSDEEDEVEEEKPVVEDSIVSAKAEEVEVAAPSDEEDEVEEEKPVVEESIVTAKAEEVEVAAPSDEEDEVEEEKLVVEESIVSTKHGEVQMGVVTAPSDEEDEADKEEPVVEEPIVYARAEEVEVVAPSDEEDVAGGAQMGVVVAPSDEEDEVGEDESVLEEMMVPSKTEEVERGAVTVPSEEEDEVEEDSDIKERAFCETAAVKAETQPQTLSGYVSEEYPCEDETVKPAAVEETLHPQLAEAVESSAGAEEQDRSEDDEELMEFEETERSLQNEDEEFGSDQSVENLEPENDEAPPQEPQKIEIEKEISSEGQVEYPEFDQEADQDKEAVLQEQMQALQDVEQPPELTEPDDDYGGAEYHYENIDYDSACHGRKKVLVETRMGSIEIEEIEPVETEEFKSHSVTSQFQEIVEKSEDVQQHAEVVGFAVGEQHSRETVELDMTYRKEITEEVSVSSVYVTSETSHSVVSTITHTIREPDEIEEFPEKANESVLLEAMPEVPTKSPHISSDEEEEDQDDDQIPSSRTQDDADEEVYSTSMKILGSTPDEIDDIEVDDEKDGDYQDQDYEVRDEDIDQEIEEQEQLTAALMSQLSKSDSGGEEEDQERFDPEVTETTETCLEQIIEHSTESETLAEDQVDTPAQLKSDFVRVNIPILEHALGLQDDSRGTPSTESGSYSMRTEPSLKEAKEEDMSEDRSLETARQSEPDMDKLFGKIDKDKEEAAEDIDRAFEKYEKEAPLVAPIDAQVGEDVLEADEDIDRAFEVHEDGKEQPLVVPIDAEVGEDLAEVKEDIDQAFAVYGTESAPPANEIDAVDSVPAVKEEADNGEQEVVEDLVIREGIRDTQAEPSSDKVETEEYEVKLSKAIVKEALYTSIETTRKMEENLPAAPISSKVTTEEQKDADNKAGLEEHTEAEKEEKVSHIPSTGIMADLQEMEAEQGRTEAMSEDELDDGDYAKEDGGDNFGGYEEVVDNKEAQLDETHSDDSEGITEMDRSIDRIEITIEEPGPEQITKAVEDGEDETAHRAVEPEREAESVQESEIESERQTSNEASEIIVEERSQCVRSKDDGAQAVVEEKTEEEEETSDLFPEAFVDRKEEFLELILETLGPDGHPRSPVLPTPESAQDGSGDSSPTAPGYPRIENDGTEDSGPVGGAHFQGPADGLTMGVGLHLPRSPLHPTSSTEVHDRSGSPSDLEEEIKEMDAKLQYIQMKFDEGSQESQDEEEAYFSPEAPSPYSSQSGQSGEDNQRKQRSLFMASSISGSEFTSQSDAEYYTGQSGETTGTSSYFTARSEVMSSSSFTSGPSETMTGSECTLTGSEGGQDDEDNDDEEDEDEETEGFSQRLVIQKTKQITTETVQYPTSTGAVSSSEGERGVVSSSEGERAVMSSTDDEKEDIDDDEEEDAQFGGFPLDRPPSVSDFTLIESMDQEKLNISLGLVSDITARTAIHSPLARSSELLTSPAAADQVEPTLPSPGSLSAPRDSDMEKDSLQGDDEDEGEAGDYDKEESEEEDEEGRPLSDQDGRMNLDDTQSDRPPSPSDFTLIASQDQESLNRILGLDQYESPEAGQGMLVTSHKT